MALNPSTGKIYSIGFWSGGMHPDALPVTEWDVTTRSVSSTIMVSPAADQRAILIDPIDADYFYMTEGDHNLLRKVHIPTGQEVTVLKFSFTNVLPHRIIAAGDIGYITCLDSRTVFKVDFNTGDLAGFFYLPSGFKGMTEGGYHKGYLYFPWADSILKINPDDGRMVEQYQLSRYIHAGQMTFFGDKAVLVERYEGLTTGKSLVFFDTQTMEIIKTIDMPATEHSDKAFLSPDGSKLYTSYGTSTTTIKVINTETLQVITDIVVPISDSYISKVSNNADGFFDVERRRFYLTGWGAVFVVDMDTDTLIDVLGTTEGDIDIDFGRDVGFSGLSGVALNQGKDKLLVSSLDTGKMIIYDLIQERWLTNVIRLNGHFTTDEAESPNGSYVFTVNRESDNISVIDTSTLKLLKNITLAEPGDCNNDGSVELTDAICALKILSQINPADNIIKWGDVNQDGKIGLEEATYILQLIADLR